MEATALRIRKREIADRNIVGRPSEQILRREMIKQPRFSQLSFRAKSRNPVAMFQVPPRDSSTPLRVAQNDRAITVLLVAFTISIIPQLHADIPWPEVVQRLAYENDKLARRPHGHNGEYFVVCTLYY